jgi:hypothetical protein
VDQRRAGDILVAAKLELLRRGMNLMYLKLYLCHVTSSTAACRSLTQQHLRELERKSYIVALSTHKN